MEHKTVPLTGIKTAGLADGEFEGWAACFDNVDAHGEIIRRGAFAKSLASGQVTPLIWEHQSRDPRMFVGEVVEAAEVPEGLHVRGKFDDSEFGKSAYANVKGRRVTGLSIGYVVRNATKNAQDVTELLDVDLAEISVVSRPANDRALITGAKSVDRREHLRERVARAQIRAKGDPAMVYEPTDPTNPMDAALIRALTPSAEKLRAASERVTQERVEHLGKAREITELARELDRELSEQEAEQVETHLKAAEDLDRQLAAHIKSQNLLAQLDAMAAGKPDGLDGPTTARPGDDNRRLSFKGMAASAAAKMLGSNEFGTKALAPSGATVVGQEFQPDPIPLGRVATGLLDVLPVKVHSSPEYAYMRQGLTGRTNNAAVVAAGAVKPTSRWELSAWNRHWPQWPTCQKASVDIG